MRLPIQIQAILYRKTNREIQYLLLKRKKDSGNPKPEGIEKRETKTQPPKKKNTKRNKNRHYQLTSYVNASNQPA